MWIDQGISISFESLNTSNTCRKIKMLYLLSRKKMSNAIRQLIVWNQVHRILGDGNIQRYQIILLCYMDMIRVIFHFWINLKENNKTINKRRKPSINSSK